MERRLLLKVFAALPFVSSFFGRPSKAAPDFSRVRPGDPGWPSDDQWIALARQLEGELIRVESPLTVCIGAAADVCAPVFVELKNPYYLGDEVGLTQSLGWVGAWTSRPSVYAVAAHSTADVVTAVNFARTHNLRLVVKGGGHSYQGSSNAADSLLIWTRRMAQVIPHDAFLASGCEGQAQPQAAVSIGAGAIWGHVYAEVMARGGRYVQGGGCMTVGVAGFISGGGFGSLSKRFGLGAAHLLEAEVVTADGDVKLANACTNPDLFWALKGGGAGFGVVTRLTVRTHELPSFVGLFSGAIEAASDEAYRRLVEKAIAFYREALFNPNWGEQLRFSGRRLEMHMVFNGLDRSQAEKAWRPFFDWFAATPQDYHVVSPPRVLGARGREFWDPGVLRQAPGLVVADDRAGAPADNIAWAGDVDEAGQVIHAYQSVWLPASLLEDDQRAGFVDALVAAANRYRVSLHFNKGLAGASAEALATASETAMNPVVAEAFALAIIGSHGQPAYPGVPGHEPNEAEAKTRAAAVTAAMAELLKLVPQPASYVWETDYFQSNWQDAFWGENYARLRAVKDKYDPEGLFFVHHGVGSEDWSADGFRRTN
jgi:FAD/FMN-containing dehydrogenase